MGSRFWISGAQLGIMKFFIEKQDKKELTKLWQTIFDEQYIADGTTFDTLVLKLKEGKKEVKKK